MVKKIALTICMVTAVIVFAFAQTASSAQEINYQGRLTDLSGTPITGNYTIEFKIYDVETGGTTLWSETHTAVPVLGGFFTVKLGSINSLTPINFGNQLWLGIKVGGDPEMSPRLKFEDAPYALGSKDNFIVTGAVGIGTASPAAPLHVSGYNPSGRGTSIVADSGLTIENTGLLRLMTGGNYYWDLFSNNGGYGVENLVLRYFNSDMVFFQAYEGKVGIGTISPQAKLHVSDERDGVTALKIGNYAAGGRQYLQIDVENSDPPPGDCNEDIEVGRMVVKGDTRQLFICMPPGSTGTYGWHFVVLQKL